MCRLNVMIGFSDWRAKIIQMNSILIAGASGTGKSYHLRGILSSIINLNNSDSFDMHIYTSRSTDYIMDNLITHNVVKSDDNIETNRDILISMSELFKSRKAMVDNEEVEEKCFKPVIFVYDNVLRNPANDVDTMRILHDVLKYGELYCIDFIITCLSHIDFGTEFTDEVPIKIVHRCSADVSSALINDPVAACPNFNTNRKVAVKIGKTEYPIILDSFTISEEQGLNLVHLVSYL